VTHRYTLLVGGTILPGPGHEPCTAIAWAEGTVLALGTDAQVRSASRGDSHLVDLHGAFVVALGPDADPTWPPLTALEVGGPADLALLAEDPRSAAATSLQPAAIIRAGHVVRGRLASPHEHAEGH
jgi:predicted amidohydrolase YtcJ